LNHASSSFVGSDRDWRFTLARQQLHTDGTIHQVDLECRRGHQCGLVAPEYLRTLEQPFQDPLEGLTAGVNSAVSAYLLGDLQQDQTVRRLGRRSFRRILFCRAAPPKNCRLTIGPERSEGLTIGREEMNARKRVSADDRSSPGYWGSLDGFHLRAVDYFATVSDLNVERLSVLASKLGGLFVE